MFSRSDWHHFIKRWDDAAIKRIIFSILFPLVFIVLFALENELFNLRVNPRWAIFADQRIDASIALGIVLLGPSMFLRNKWRYLYLLSVTSLCSVIFVAQAVSFKVFGTFVQVTALKYAWLAGMVSDSIQAFLDPLLLVFLIPPVVAIFAWALSRRLGDNSSLSWKTSVIVACVLLVASGLAFRSFSLRDRQNTEGISVEGDQVYGAARIGIISYSARSAVRSLARSRVPTPEDRALITRAQEDVPARTKEKFFGAAKGRNLILVQVESLESAVMNRKVNGQEITPVLNALTKEGLYFSNHYAQIGPGITADAEFSVLNSLYPLMDDVAFVDFSSNEYMSLPMRLKNNGYQTVAMNGDIPAFWNHATMYPALGFDRIYAQSSFRPTRDMGKARLGDADLLDQSATLMESLPQPFMVYLYTLSSHLPCKLPADLQTLPLPSTGFTSLQRQYLEAMHYADDSLGAFMKRIKIESWYANSLIVIYGDHGSLTGIDGALGVTGIASPAMEKQHVPMIVLAPGLDLVKEITTPSSHLDLYPTVANLLGITSPVGIMGQDLLNPSEPIVASHRNGSGAVDAFVGVDRAFIASEDGIFDRGRCVSVPEKLERPVQDCRFIFDRETRRTAASDTAVRKNLVRDLVGISP